MAAPGSDTSPTIVAELMRNSGSMSAVVKAARPMATAICPKPFRTGRSATGPPTQ
jgi:hypothetical protein